MLQKVILTIGDCYALNRLIKTVLSKDFYVYLAECSASAVTYLHSDLSIKAIIIDISDTTSENFVLLEHINSSCILRNIKIVVISDSNDQSLKNNVTKLGSLLFLTKPFDPIYLSNSLRSLLNGGNTRGFIKRLDHLKLSD